MPIETAMPLSVVTFCVLDLETTGTDPTFDEITEVGAVRVQGGERLGTFHTLIGAGTDAMRAESMLPHLLEFVRDSVIVGHNVQFDLRFLNAALRRSGRAPLDTGAVVDTMPLARRLVRDDVHDCRLGTLAHRFELEHRPSHRAFEDAAATVDLLHLLIERSSAFGVVALDDLVALPSVAGGRYGAKLRLTTDLPRAPGVYLCHDRHDQVIHVGAADELRYDVRSLFGSGGRRDVAPVLRALERISCEVVGDPLDRALVRIRMLQQHRPALQRRALAGDRAVYVHIDPSVRSPRATVVRSPRRTGAHLGPCLERATAVRSVEALHHVRADDPAWADAACAAATSRDDATALIGRLRGSVGVRRERDDAVGAAVLASSIEALDDLFSQHHAIETARAWSSAPAGGPLPTEHLDEVLAISRWQQWVSQAEIAPAPR